MQRISADFAIPDIIGRQLNQVGVGKWDAQFHFEHRTIQSMGRVDWIIDGSATTIFDGKWLDIAPVQDFVGLSASGWNRLDDHSFDIVLENQGRIVFFTQDNSYEEIIVHPEMWIF